ncbi:hypothetical protein K7X08_013167 [Anisodus acutangulus]|uniref:Ycf49-like protein n=2 Tax=Anisodus TaxID=243963 RepID=A0A9Q1MAJ0_9SOLA|nr:hypothetical protein K7X08_013167 [Anisodus acutangulus]
MFTCQAANSITQTAMAIPTLISLSKIPLLPQPKRTQFTLPTTNSKFLLSANQSSQISSAATILGVTGIALATLMAGPATANASEITIMGSSLQFNEPSNALSLPTWAIHVSSVVEWITAMALVWQYGEKSGNASWKGLSWGMVPLLGGAFCACTWHFFYNSESLEVLVALQAALTVLGNATMCIAAFRIYRSQEQSNNL